MLVDINQFKRINAQWGHRVGDKVLVSIVDIIQQSIRPDDILARLEGEVFGLLFTELNSAQAKIIAKSPDIILADEPTGSLDERNRSYVMDILKELNRQGKTIVVVTHDPYVSDCATRHIAL